MPAMCVAAWDRSRLRIEAGDRRTFHAKNDERIIIELVKFDSANIRVNNTVPVAVRSAKKVEK